MKATLGIAALFLAFAGPILAAEPDIVIADFEGETYGEWKATGTAFGAGPAHGAFPGQMPVDGYEGKGLVNSFNGGDASTGTLTSPEFRIERRYIKFLIGGGGWEGRTCMNLVVDGKIVRTATGINTKPGGSEMLKQSAWDIAEFSGKAAHLVIVDDATGGWGHINIDQIVQTNLDRALIMDSRRKRAISMGPDEPRSTPYPLAVKLVSDATREVTASKHWLQFPVKTGANKRVVTVSVDGKIERRFDIELAEGESDWWAPLDVSAWTGKKLTISVNRLPEISKALDSIQQADEFIGAENLYHEALRPQLQFSSKRGWMNDPNGLVFYNGEYYLFFQHNPYGWTWGNMHWGYATSRDLVHWQEQGEALYPDDMGPMFSGSAVVDWKNTSGLGVNGKPPMVLMYTASGKPTVQGLAFSTDGRKFTKYAGNPVLQQITPGNRDPKVMWYEPTKQWVLTLYVGLPGDPGPDGKPKPTHTVHFFTSPDLKNWTLRSVTPGLYECPDFFELPLDGDAAKKKWVLTAASSEYFVGAFDGEKFTPETAKLPGQRGRGFYAAQTFSDTPDHRRIQIGWGQDPSPGMPFNQLQAFPCELKLLSTPDGPRLAWQPIKEIESLRVTTHRVAAMELKEGSANPLAQAHCELLEIRADFTPSEGSEITFKVRGVEIRYDAGKQEIILSGVRAPAPLRDGHQRLIILTDRTNFTVWASDGLAYVPMPVIAKPTELTVEVSVKGAPVMVHNLEAHELKSIWDDKNSK